MPQRQTITQFLNEALSRPDDDAALKDFIEFCRKCAEQAIDYENIHRRTKNTREKQWAEFIDTIKLWRKFKGKQSSLRGPGDPD